MTLFQYTLGYIWVIYMQIYATLPFSGCSLLKATGNFSSAPPPLILHFTRSSTHSNVHEGARLERNWIKSNPPKLHGAWRKEHRSKRKGTCYLTPALHLISPDCLETISHLGDGRTEGLRLSTNFMKPPVVVQIWSAFTLSTWSVFFSRRNQAAGVTGETSTAGKKRKEKAASAASVLIDIPAEESEYSNVSKLCYLTWESAEIRG